MAEKFNRATFTKNFIKKITRIKRPDEMLEQASEVSLEKTLGVWDLIILGIGAIIGSGIFAVVGVAAAGSPDGGVGAGPALVVSMIIALVACIFSALCYSEFATMIPVAGGAYIYTFATLGEFAAWMVGWVLMLEYAVGFIACACAWSNHFVQFLSGFSHVLPSWLANPPVWLMNNTSSALKICKDAGVADVTTVIPHIAGIPICINLPAIFMIILTAAILIKGTKDSAKMAGIMVIIKLAVIALFVLGGAFYVKPENWTPFAPNGFEGIFAGAFLIFFAYIGFDAVATAAEECKNPQRDLPIAILGTLVICTILYVCVALVLTGIVPIERIDIQAPIAHAMSYIGKDWFAGLISVGALCALTSVLLIYQLGTTRILYAISRDRFLPKSWRLIHKKYKTPHVMTWISGLVVIVCGLFMDLNISAALCNFGTFTSFVIICLAVLILRKTEPNRHRPFKVPFCPWFPLAGILICGLLIVFSLNTLKTSSIYFVLWLLAGLLIYAFYGYHQKRIEERGRIIRKRK